MTPELVELGRRLTDILENLIKENENNQETDSKKVYLQGKIQGTIDCIMEVMRMERKQNEI